MQCGLDSALRDERPDHVPSEHWLQLWGPWLFRGFLPGLPVFLLLVLSHWLHSEPAPAQVAVWITACCRQGAVILSNNSMILNSRICSLPSYHPRVCPPAFHLPVNNYISPLRNTGQFPSQGHPVHLPPRSLPLPCPHWIYSGGSAGRTGGPEQKGWAFGLYFKANKGVLELQGLGTGQTVEGKYISKPEWKWFWCSFCLSFKKEKLRNITLWFLK